MTDKIYQREMDLKETETKVVRVDGDRVWLEATIFAPAAGGQPADHGWIGDWPVVDVEEADGEIVHRIGRPGVDPGAADSMAAAGERSDQTKNGNLKADSGAAPGEPEALSAGAVVRLRLNWQRRLDHMQNHLGEHILSAIFKREYGLDNRGFHLGEETGTFDIDAKEISQEMLDHVEDLANQVVYQAIPVQVQMIESAEEAAKLPLRKGLKAEEDITIVTVPGVDCVACCCPHPASTAQIGIIKILYTEKYKGMTRVYYKCGRRALLDYRLKHRNGQILNQKYSADPWTLLEKIRAADEKTEAMRREKNRIQSAYAAIFAENLLKQDDPVLVLEMEDADLDDLRRIGKKVTAETERPVILSSVRNLCVFLTHSGQNRLQCGQIVREFAVGAGGKGGGSDTQAQVFFTDLELQRNFVKIAEASAR